MNRMEVFGNAVAIAWVLYLIGGVGAIIGVRLAPWKWSNNLASTIGAVIALLVFCAVVAAFAPVDVLR